MQEELRQAQYVSCLHSIYGVVAAWEELATDQAPPWLEGIVAARQRRQMLDRDLFWFHTPSSLPRAIMPPIDSAASLLGAMYVMEGSTLGGQLISRHVTRVLALSNGDGDAYFRGHGNQTGPLWKEFCTVLQTSVPDADTDAVIHSAKAMFQVFTAWMQAAPLPQLPPIPQLEQAIP